MRVGLTGGIASGKSTVADLFTKHGVAVIDTDIIAREVVVPGTPALAEIRAAFGADVFVANGELDRGTLRQLIFADDDKRRKLESILHPRIQKETLRQAQRAGGDYQLVVVPLLVESPLKRFVDRILSVECEPSTQIDRLLARDGGTIEEARRIVHAQATPKERRTIATETIFNQSDLAALTFQVDELHAAYAALAAGR